MISPHTKFRKARADCQSPIPQSPSPRHAVTPSHSSRRPREQGIALVITLILLSVITFMAITFLVVSRTDKGSVNATTEQARSANAASSGVERAKAELIAAMLASGDPYNIHMWVSTNYINAAGFDPNAPFPNPTNVNYDYTTGGAPLTPLQHAQNLGNLLIDARLPVYITNRAFANSNEFRFYVDLNRNHKFDATGLLPVRDGNGNYFDTNGATITTLPAPNVVSNSFTGDPQFIAIFEKTPYTPSLFNPNLTAFTHSATNRGVARYAYMVIPISDTMDVNFIHNNAKTISLNGEGFFRNQGVGTWEINLASFLVDLNTNYWSIGYQYDTNIGNISRGTAFADASSLLSYRYNKSWRNLSTIPALFQAKGFTAFTKDGIDGLTDGPLMDGLATPPDNDAGRIVKSVWPGTDNPSHFFSTQDFFDPTKANQTSAFADRLSAAGTNVDSYNQNTFYRLFSQLGTDSAPDQSSKMNLNYDNLAYVDPISGVRSATNFHAWAALDFFTNAASRMLAAEGFDPKTLNINNIQVYPTNMYSASVHRLLQVAANIYDASSSDLLPGTANLSLPTIFKPTFICPDGLHVFINGFTQVTNLDVLDKNITKMVDLSVAADRAAITPADMVYGKPLVVGAKKGYPNFNEYSMQHALQIRRRLQFTRSSPSLSRPDRTNQMLIVSMTNVFGVEAWNSYSNSFPRDLEIRIGIDITASLTNNVIGAGTISSNRISQGIIMPIPKNTWAGFVNPATARFSFKMPLNTNFTFLGDSTYRSATRNFVPRTDIFEAGQGFYNPDWLMNLQTRLRFIVVDTAANRIIDYVNIDASETPLDVNQELAGNQTVQSNPNSASAQNLWVTNRLGGSGSLNVPTWGVLSQIEISKGNIDVGQWNSANADPSAGQDKTKAINGFYYNIMGIPKRGDPGPYYSSNVFYSPYVPVGARFSHVNWQANDPLVHYTVGDLIPQFQTNSVTPASDTPPNANLGTVNTRYEPWGKRGGPTDTPLDLSIKDPGVRRSDDWDFPTNKFPNVGWLGRIHRGTPWQTIYLKSPIKDLPGWMKWTGNPAKPLTINYGQWNTNIVPILTGTNDAYFTHPFNDRAIIDLFTTSFDQNSSRGRMSVNQTNLASWSAVLGGVALITNTTTDAEWQINPSQVPQFGAAIVNPAGNYDPAAPPPLVRLVNSINDARRTNYANNAFNTLGGFLAAPEVTVNSPFLNQSSDTLKEYGINDAAYERIPQQILGLLKLDPPRFVIYSYGQSLKPADRSVVTGGPFFGMCTNYQITAETTTRAVVRIEGAPNNPRVVVESFNILPPD